MLQQTQDWASLVYRTGRVSELTLTCQRIVSHLMSILQVRNATAVLPPIVNGALRYSRCFGGSPLCCSSWIIGGGGFNHPLNLQFFPQIIVMAKFPSA